MDVISLPLVAAEVPLQQALTVMEGRQRAAVALEDGGRLELVGLGQVRAAISKGRSSFLDISEREPLYIARAADVESHGIDLVRPSRNPGAFAPLLGKRYRFALTGASHSTAIVVTASETLRAALVGGFSYHCDGPGRHGYPMPVMQVGDPCLYCTGIVQFGP